MNTKHLTNSPFQRERAKLGQMQKPAPVFPIGEDVWPFLNAPFCWWFLCLLVCLSPLASHKGIALAGGVWASPSHAIGCPHSCAISCPHAALCLPRASPGGVRDGKLSCRGSILRAGGGEWGPPAPGVPSPQPHLPPRATGCL